MIKGEDDGGGETRKTEEQAVPTYSNVFGTVLWIYAMPLSQHLYAPYLQTKQHKIMSIIASLLQIIYNHLNWP